MSRKRTKTVVWIGMMAAATAVFSQIAIPMPSGVPLSLQMFAVALAGYLLGARDGTASVLVYLALGAFGVPVFAGFGGGFAVLTGPTGGFLFGFLPFALVCGVGQGLREKSKAAAIGCSFAGVILCHLCGVLWYGAVSGNGVVAAFALASLPYLLKDALSLILAFLLAKRLRKHRS